MVNNRSGSSIDNNNFFHKNGNLSKAWNFWASNTIQKPSSKEFYAGASGGVGTYAAGRRLSKNSKITLSAAELKAMKRQGSLFNIYYQRYDFPIVQGNY